MAAQSVGASSGTGEAPGEGLSSAEVSVTTDAVTTALLEQIADLRVAEREFLRSGDKFVTFANTLALTGLTLGLVDDVPIALVVIPYAIMAILFFMMQIYTERFSRAGHRRYLEEHVNMRLKHVVYIEQQAIAPLRDNRWSVRYATVLYAGVVVATLVLAKPAADTLAEDHAWLYPSLISALAVLVVGLSITAGEMMRADNAAYRRAKARYGG